MSLEIHLEFVSFALQTEFYICCLYNVYFCFTAGISFEVFGVVHAHRTREVNNSQSVDWQQWPELSISVEITK